uniref:U56-Liphistoxin-Lsp1a_2 n=1 Tax=Liphistius sp. SGP-2016 TaxID=1905180 RepID=A0A4Q8K413_9ARAC
MARHWFMLLCVLVATQGSWQNEVGKYKDGFCPNPALILVQCDERIDKCCYDSQCPDIEKCCFSFCGYFCTKPFAEYNGNLESLPTCEYSPERK